MKNNKIKLIAVDIDGTIMDKHFQLSENVINVIRKAVKSGIYVVLATGRMYAATVNIARRIGLKTPLITYQGSMVRKFNDSDEILLHDTISDSLARKIIDELRSFNIQINVYLDDKMYVEYESPLLIEYAEKRDIHYNKVKNFDNIKVFCPTKILFIEGDPDRTSEIRDYLRSKYSDDLYITKSTPIFGEVVSNKASKGKALKLLADMWKISKDEIMAIGDQDNDIELFEAAGLRIAMGNATKDLKKKADYITDSVDNDGAAKAIQKFALGE